MWACRLNERSTHSKNPNSFDRCEFFAEQIQKLEGELAAIFNQGAAASEAGEVPASKPRKKKRIVSAKSREKMAAAQRGEVGKKKAQ